MNRLSSFLATWLTFLNLHPVFRMLWTKGLKAVIFFFIGLKRSRALGYKLGDVRSDLESGTDKLCHPD